MNFTHDSITINNRTVALPDILSGSAVSLSRFETETFSFIKKWLTGAQNFSLTTSGSTGTPKEIILTRNQLQQSATRTIKALGLSSNHIALVCLDTKYIAGKMMLVRALEGNMKIIAVEPTANPLQKLSINHQPDFAAFVPLQLEAILSDPATAKQLNQFKSIIIGGASVSENLKSKILNLTCPVYATYGMTETVSHIALQRLNGSNPTAYFETLPTIKINADTRGCLVIDLPDFTEPIITNDLVTIINDSSFLLLGRYDNVINSGGVKLIPETIEKKIAVAFAHANIYQQFFITGISDERLGEKLVLIVEGNSDKEAAILSCLKRELTGYEIPKQIFFLPEFNRTETGKINRLATNKLLITR